MKARTIFIFVLLFFGASFQCFPQGLNLDGNGRPQFNISSSTLILDGEGNSIDFSTFIKLNPGIDYKDLHPKFNATGDLESITIQLLRPLTKPKPVTVTRSTPVYTSNSYPTTTISSPTTTRTYTPPPKVERVTTERTKKFRFTTAKELEGLQAPFFSEKDIYGKEYNSTNLLGKIVVIKFWFLRCGPCLEEIPQLNQLVSRYQNNPNVKFLAAATDDYEDVKKFLTKKDFKYTMLYDTYDIHGDFKVAGYPTHMVIHKNGTVAKVYTGKNSNLANSISKVIEQAMLLQSDDKSMKEVPQPLYTIDKVFKAKEGILSKKQYLEKLASGLYSVFLKEKIDGRTEYYLMKK